MRGSLRRRLIAACLAIELGAGLGAAAVSHRLLQQSLREQVAAQADEITALLQQAIAAPLAQRDYAAVQQFLDAVRPGRDLRYLAVSDHRNRVVATSGWDPATPLPPRDDDEVDLDRADSTLHLVTPIEVAGQSLGRLDLGLSTDRLRAARTAFVERMLWIGGAAMLASALMLAAVAFAITRGLRSLTRASERIGAGDYDVAVPVASGDEVGRLATAFNTMAGALKHRVAALQASEQAQRDERTRLATLLGAMRSGIAMIDGTGRVAFVNDAFLRLWMPSGPVLGNDAAALQQMLRARVEDGDRATLQALLRPADPSDAAELRLRDGRLVSQRVQPLPGRDGGCIWFHQDITLDRQMQQRAHQALLDPLTRLPNRRGLYDTLQSTLARAQEQGESVALMFLDLDDFKHANDIGGHRTGDEILVAVGQALAAQLRRHETAARLGGDEFAVLCPGVGAAEAAIIAGRLVQAVSDLRFEAAGQSLRVGCSAGIALFPADARTGDELIACADTAMYQAKRAGKNGWAAYRRDAATAAAAAEHARVDWNDRIHRALQDNRFVLHFQGVYRATDLGIAYHEALVRMVDEHDAARLILPADFVPHAERSGKIRQLDRWVVSRCIAQLADNPAAGAIAANLSARSLEDAEFAPFLRAELQQADVDPRRLHLEITETAGLNDPVAARQLIGALRGLGCSVHLDDFGAGFSSFAQLKLLDVDSIKIDGSFIRDLAHDPSNRLFVASMIEIAHNLGKTAVAEHVEDPETVDALRVMGVDLVQGFHLGRPTPKLADVRTSLRLVGGDTRPGDTRFG